MHRFMVVCVLVASGCVLAGCGQSIDQIAKEKAKMFLGDGHAHVLRVETTQNMAGTREAMVALRGHFHPAFSCGLGPCHGFSYVWLSFDLSSSGSEQGFSSTSASELAAIDAAKSANPLFSIFPDWTNPAIRCDIPRGDRPASIAGACVMLFNPTGQTTRIEFRERWPFAPSRNGLWAANQRVGGWIVTIGQGGRVQSARVFGDRPPQLWK